jgi:hypothetical protein
MRRTSSQDNLDKSLSLPRHFCNDAFWGKSSVGRNRWANELLSGFNLACFAERRVRSGDGSHRSQRSALEISQSPPALAPIIPVARLCRLGGSVHLASHGPLLGATRWGSPLSLNGQLVVVWCCCCLSPENVSVGPRSQSSPVPFVAFALQPICLYTQRFASYHNRIQSALLTISPTTMLSLVTLSFSLLLSFATAQSTQVTWIEPGPSAGAFTYAGSVVDACPGTTVFALQCISGSRTELCGTDAPVRLHHNATSLYEYRY